MSSKPTTCRGCPLETLGTGFIGTHGSGSSGILFVGEAPGKDELGPKRPFVGKAGRLLDRLLYRLGTTQDVHIVDNVIRCRPPGNELSGAAYEAGAVAHCSPHLDETVRSTTPKVIVALGGSALKRVSGVSPITRYRGFVLDSHWPGIPVVATFHPSFLLPRRGSLAGAKHMGTVLRDIRMAMAIAAKGFERPPTCYLVDPELAVVEHHFTRWAQRPPSWLAFDIETNYKSRKEATTDIVPDERITRIAFSDGRGFGITMPFEGGYLAHIRALIERPNLRTVGWNSRTFDIPRLRTLGGMNVPLEHHYDGMDMFHTLLPNVNKGLEFAASYGCPHLRPWKHLSKSDMGLYSCIDVDATVTLAAWLEGQ